MKKRTLTSIISAGIALSAVMTYAVPANADFYIDYRGDMLEAPFAPGDEGKVYNEDSERYEDCACVDMGSIFFDCWKTSLDGMPYVPGKGFVRIWRSDPGIDLYFYDAIVYADGINRVELGVDSDFKYPELKEILGDDMYCVEEEGGYYDIFTYMSSAETLRALEEKLPKLNEVTNVKKCVVTCDMTVGKGVVTLDSEYDTLLVYVKPDDDYEKMESEISGLLTENGYKFGIEADNKRMYVVWEDEMSLTEQAGAVQLIYDELGYCIPKHMLLYESIGEGSWIEPPQGGEIDLLNNIPGDANCDGKFSIADSAAILQSMANQDKYGLSLQGEYNGDIYGDYDGISGLDALEVQKILAGIA